MTGAAAFIGFFLGAILLIIGLVLVLGGRREVVIVERFTPAPSRSEPTL
jgi:Ca2+/H+ antiporter